MSDYRCYFLGRDGKFKAVEEFHSANAALALLQAFRFFRSQSEYPRFELWTGSHLIHAE